MKTQLKYNTPQNEPSKPDRSLPPYPLPDTRRSDRRMLVYSLLLVLLYFVISLPIDRQPATNRALWGLTASIADEKSFSIDYFVSGPGGSSFQNAGEFPGIAYFQGHYYAGVAPGTSIAALPFYMLGRWMGNPEAWGAIFTAFLGGFSCLLVYHGTRKLGSSTRSATYAGLALGLATLLWREAGMFAPPVLSMFVLALSIYLSLPPLPRQLAHNHAGKRINFTHGLGLGVLLGFALVVDYQNAVWTPVFLAYLVFARRATRNGWSGLGLGWLGGLLPLLFYNYLIFGNPLAFTYGFLLYPDNLTSFSGQFLGGFSLNGIWQSFFGPGRSSLGVFMLFFGVWGLVAVWWQRGKRGATNLLAGLFLLIVISGLFRQPLEEGQLKADFLAAALLPLAYGSAVWFERLLFLTRLEYRGLPGFSTLGLALYYFISPPGPALHNLSGLLSIWPLLLFTLPLFWPRLRNLFENRRVQFSTVSVLLFLILLPAIWGSGRPVFASAAGNNLLYNPELTKENGRVSGWYNLNSNKVQGNTRFLPYLAPVQGGKVYSLSFKREVTTPANLEITWVWRDDGHEVLTSYSASYTLDGSNGFSDRRASPPAAAYLQIIFNQTGGQVTYSDFYLYEDGVRIELLKNYATAALSFSFDWESAMGGLVHSRGGGGGSYGETGGDALSEENVQAVLKYAEERGMEMRQGADNLLNIFLKYNISGTFYATGYNLLDGNTDRQLFSGNPVYRWAKPPFWPNDYWSRTPWFAHDPYGTYQTHPAWYFGDQTTRLKDSNQEIASHTFGHLLVRAATPLDLTADINEWLRAARAKGLPSPRSFAFPWKGSNSLTPAFYDVLYKAGFRFITRTYNLDQGYEQDSKDGIISFLAAERDQNGQPMRTAEPTPENTYFYLDRVHYALFNSETGSTRRSTDPRFLVMHDYQLLHSGSSEQASKNIIDELLRRRGSYGSIWTHPEAVVNPGDVESWERVVAYAAPKREQGLWVAGVEEILQFRVDAQKVQVKTRYLENGKKLEITLHNPTERTLDGLTLSLPAPVKNAPGAAGFKGAQLIAPALSANGTVMLVVELL